MAERFWLFFGLSCWPLDDDDDEDDDDDDFTKIQNLAFVYNSF